VKSRIALAGVLGFVVILLVWNFAFFAPAGRDQDHAKQKLDTAQQQGNQLDARLRDLKKISVNAPEQKAKLDKLNAAVPVTADLEGFIRSAVDLEQQAGVDWVDVEPTPPVAGGTASQIKMSIVISGGFFQVLDYLNRLESLSRLVVVDGINIAAGGGGSSSGSGTTPTTSASAVGGAPQLTVTLNARMFTQEAVAGAAGTGTGSGTTPATIGRVTTTTAGAK
jgi:Tfp pilus assembly protein PilO